MARPRKAFGQRKPGHGAQGGPVQKRRRPLLRYGLISALVLLMASALGGYVYLQSLYRGMPDLPTNAQLWTKGREPAVEFRTEDGQVLAIRGPRYGRPVSLDSLPAHVPQAFIAVEDKRFYEHGGADLLAMLRAAWSNWRSGETVSGASTITQQLVKNLVLSPEQTLKRKVQEVRLARELEARLSKVEILELYLNRTYFGAGFYGLDAASQHYFGRDPGQLRLGEAALLAALPKAPSRLALTDNLDAARARQAHVLDEMVNAGFVSTAQAARARVEEVRLVERAASDLQLGYVLDLAMERIAELLPEAPPDLVVTLSIDPELQAEVQAILEQAIIERGEALKAGQAAAVLMRPDGRVAALVGGVDYGASQFNRVTQARRQPGSAFKPIVFAAAMETGLGPYDVRTDAPVRIGRWQPRNYGGAYVGPVTLSEAMARSLNTVAVRLSREAGIERVITMARRLGITERLKPLASTALGSQEVTLWDLTRAYGAFLRAGERLDPALVLRVEDTRGRVLYAPQARPPRQALARPIALDMTAMLSHAVEAGTGQAARIEGWEVAGKTGTSQDWRDAWFVGYTAHFVGGVWVGNDDDSAMDEVTGGDLPAELFARIMGVALEGKGPAALEGAGRDHPVSEAAQARIGFYRDLATAFSDVAGREVETLEPAAQVAARP